MKESELWDKVIEAFEFYAQTNNHALYCVNGNVIPLTGNGLCLALRMCSDDRHLGLRAVKRLKDWWNANHNDTDLELPILSPFESAYMFNPGHRNARHRVIVAAMIRDECLEEEGTVVEVKVIERKPK